MRYDLNIYPMKYTKYLSSMIASQGVPNANPEQLKTILNIVHIEGRLQQLEELRKQAQKSVEPHQFDLLIFTHDKRLYQITHAVDPSIYFKKLLSEQ